MILLVLALLYLLYKVVVFVRADADLTLLSRTLDTRYFDNKVVWVTGASSGSELLLHRSREYVVLYTAKLMDSSIAYTSISWRIFQLL